MEEYPEQYACEETPKIIQSNKHVWISISGVCHLDINNEFKDALQALSGIAFALKFKMKRKNPEGYFDYTMPPSESEWTNLDKPKEERKRKAIVKQPDFVTSEDVLRIRRIAHAKSKNTKIPQIDFEVLPSVKTVIVGHLWPYNQMEETIKKIKAFVKEQWLTIIWPHHEIYLNDLRRTKPDELKTVVKYAVK